ncbi:MAG: hypothetical protein LBR22_04555 [Desulfovibrio sp.]|nr:hypothetical protein [Desulfovibrio sp.]
MAVLYAQTGLAAPFANAAAVAPQAAMAMTRVLAHDQAKQDASIVEKTEKAQRARVAADGGGQGRGGFFGNRRRRRVQAPPSEPEEAHTLTPLVGGLLNVTV